MMHANEVVRITDLGEKSQNIPNKGKLLYKIGHVDEYGLTKQPDGWLTGVISVHGVPEYFHQVKVTSIFYSGAEL